MAPTALRRLLAVVATAVAMLGGLVGCARGKEFPDQTALVSVGGSSQTYEIESCGLDKRTIFVVGRAPDGAVVQAVMGVEDDDTTGIPASTGISIDLDPTSADTRVAAFGAESWERREMSGSPPGTITSARLRGSRIQFAGEVVPVDADDAPVPDGEAERFSIDARCDEAED